MIETGRLFNRIDINVTIILVSRYILISFEFDKYMIRFNVGKNIQDQRYQKYKKIKEDLIFCMIKNSNID